MFNPSGLTGPTRQVRKAHEQKAERIMGSLGAAASSKTLLVSTGRPGVLRLTEGCRGEE